KPALLALGTLNEFNKEILEIVVKCLSDKYTDIKCTAIKTLVKLLSLDILEITLKNTFKSTSGITSKRPFLTKAASMGAQFGENSGIEKMQKFSVGSRRHSNNEEKSSPTMQPRSREIRLVNSASSIPVINSQEKKIQEEQVDLPIQSNEQMLGRDN